MSDISSEVQKQVARIRGMMNTIKVFLPDSNVNFIVYDSVIARAEKAVREQDAVALCRILPILREMD